MLFTKPLLGILLLLYAVFFVSSKCGNDEVDVLKVWDATWEILCMDLWREQSRIYCHPCIISDKILRQFALKF